LGLTAWARDLSDWAQMVERVKHPTKKVRVGLVGTYVQLHDAYLSVAEALKHAGFALGSEVDIEWIDSEELDDRNCPERLAGLNGIIVPGGFGDRGIEGMISACRWARESNVPYFGLCLGLQIAVIEYARHVCGIEDANSGEFAPNGAHKVIDFLPDQSEETAKGGTLRLGSWPCVVQPGTTMESCYKKTPSKGCELLPDGKLRIAERHRHRYEVNNEYRDTLSKAGLVLSGISPDGHLVETVELTDRPFFVGVQYHPEFKSRPNKPHPLFVGFIEACLG
ncbi:MAG: CTP synthase, partial [Treponema sp.]|nr:CTP synthase [Treponema sp.]